MINTNESQNEFNNDLLNSNQESLNTEAVSIQKPITSSIQLKVVLDDKKNIVARYYGELDSIENYTIVKIYNSKVDYSMYPIAIFKKDISDFAKFCLTSLPTGGYSLVINDKGCYKYFKERGKKTVPIGGFVALTDLFNKKFLTGETLIKNYEKDFALRINTHFGFDNKVFKFNKSYINRVDLILSEDCKNGKLSESKYKDFKSHCNYFNCQLNIMKTRKRNLITLIDNFEKEIEHISESFINTIIMIMEMKEQLLEDGFDYNFLPIDLV